MNTISTGPMKRKLDCLSVSGWAPVPNLEVTVIKTKFIFAFCESRHLQNVFFVIVLSPIWGAHGEGALVPSQSRLTPKSDCQTRVVNSAQSARANMRKSNKLVFVAFFSLSVSHQERTTEGFLSTFLSNTPFFGSTQNDPRIQRYSCE